MTEEITIRQTVSEASGAVPAGQVSAEAPTGGARYGAEIAPGIEIHLERLVALTRQKAPIVGIHRLGDKPLPLSRAILAGLLGGLTACQITLTDELEIRAEGRHYRLRSLDMQRGSEHYKSLKAWAARERKKKATRHLPREDRRKAELLRRIATAERKAQRLWVYRPYNPALEFGDTAGDYEREQWAAWYAQKPMRRKIGCIAVAHGLIHGDIPAAIIQQPRKLYESLAALTSLNVTKYGELRTTSRSEKPTEAQYLKHLYEYVGRGSISACPKYGAAFQNPIAARSGELPNTSGKSAWTITSGRATGGTLRRRLTGSKRSLSVLKQTRQAPMPHRGWIDEWRAISISKSLKSSGLYGYD